MTIGLVIGAGMFMAAAWLGEKNALYIPAVVLGAAAMLELLLA